MDRQGPEIGGRFRRVTRPARRSGSPALGHGLDAVVAWTAEHLTTLRTDLDVPRWRHGAGGCGSRRR